MSKLFFIYLLCFCIYCNHAINAETNIIYRNHFSDVNQEKSNLVNHLDNIRAQVGLFAGTNHLSAIANNPNDTAISVSFWINPTNIELHPGTIVGEDSLFYFRYLSNRELQFNLYNKKDINTKAVLCNGQWQHLAFTLNAQGKIKIYFDGDCILTDTIQANWHQKTRKNFTIGTDRYLVHAEGMIDDLMIYNKALSEEEIKLYYEQSKITPDLPKYLQAYLPLKTNIKNKLVHSDVKITSSNVSFGKDSVKGHIIEFPNDSSFINLDGFNYDHQMTICAWVKPLDTKWLMSLIGNKDFSIRFTTKNNQLWFSVPMLFTSRTNKYHVSNNKWIHIAVSVKYNHIVDFYVNGHLIEKKNIYGKTGKSTALTIGKSIWGDNFNGSITQLALWNRALDNDEIQQVYNGKLETFSFSTSTNYALFVFFILVLVIGILIILYLFKNKKEDNLKLKYLKYSSNAIHILGNFAAYDKDGKDISNMFSPTLIRILALIILYPILKDRNITSGDLSNILWETDNASQQKNNRSTNIHRLRKVFTNFNQLELIYENKEWHFKYGSEFHIDINTIDLDLKKGKLSILPESLLLCKHLRTETFDPTIRLYEEKFLPVLKQHCLSLYNNKDYHTAIQLAKLWIELAPLNETAIQYLVSALMQNKNKQEALSHYTNFSSQYRKMLNQEFELSFEDCNIS